MVSFIGLIGFFVICFAVGMVGSIFLKMLPRFISGREKVLLRPHDKVSWEHGDFVRYGEFVRWSNGFAVVIDDNATVEHLSPSLHNLRKIGSKAPVSEK